MPIEIRELNIRINVSSSPQEQSSEQQSNVGGQPMPDKETLIAECIEQVSVILKDKEER